MAFELDAIYTSVDTKLQDNARFLSRNDIATCASDALRQLNHDKPLNLVKDIAGTGVQDYALPSEFQKGFSKILTVETPAGQNPPVFRRLDDDWYVYEDPTKPAGQQIRLRFKSTTPATGEIIRVVLTSPHAVTATASTLDQDAFMAVVYKTLELLIKGLAARFNMSIEPTIGADSVDYSGRGQNFLFLSQQYYAMYKQITGLSAEVKAGQAMGENDIKSSDGGDLLWHPARSR